MNTQLANFSTDLRRVSYWIYQGRFELAQKTLNLGRRKYKTISKVGCFDNVWSEIEKINNREDRLKAAERASTLSSILLQESFKT